MDFKELSRLVAKIVFACESGLAQIVNPAHRMTNQCMNGYGAMNVRIYNICGLFIDDEHCSYVNELAPAFGWNHP